MQCPECKSTVNAHDPITGETYCASCGLILDTPFELSLPFEEIRNPHHSAMTFTLPGKGLGTPVPPGIANYSMLKKIHAFAIADAFERSYEAAYPFLAIVWGNLRIGAQAKEEMAILYRKSIRGRLTQGI